MAIIKFIISALLLLAGVLLLLRIFENRLVFYPYKYPTGTWRPEWFGLALEDCWFTTADGVKLHGWFLKQENAVATLLWCHGNAGNISDRLDNLQRLAQLPVNVFIFDYRGYGRSDGTPSEPGVYRDAGAAYDFLLTRGISPDALIIFGRSLGAAVALELASRRECAGVILESAFTNAADMAGEMFPFLPARFVMKSKFDNVANVQKLKAPLLVIHGDADNIVPFRLGQKLFEAAKEPKSFYRIENANHNDTYLVGGQPYFDRFRQFVQDCLQE